MTSNESDPGNLPERIRQIDESRQGISQALAELHGAVDARINPMTLVRRHPMATLGAGAAAGVLLALALGRGTRSRRVSKAALASAASGWSGGVLATGLKAALAAAVMKSFTGTLLPRLVERGTAMIVGRLGGRR